jgi:putative hydrolase of the HAD superfamily
VADDQMSRISLIGFDGDDTLWFHGKVFAHAHNRMSSLLGKYIDERDWIIRWSEAQVSNLSHFGYGVKSFALSMIEATIKATCGRIQSDDILEIINLAKEMISHNVEIIGDARSVLSILRSRYKLLLIRAILKNARS